MIALTKRPCVSGPPGKRVEHSTSPSTSQRSTAASPSVARPLSIARVSSRLRSVRRIVPQPHSSACSRIPNARARAGRSAIVEWSASISPRT